MTDAASDLGSTEPAHHDQGAAFIRDAFAMSRNSGAEHWDRMTTAVLKNRILALTNRSFDESDWGAASFRDFVSQFPELVAVDASVRPAQVQLLDPTLASGGSTSMDDPEKRIRHDLWMAVLDFSSGGEYIWRDGRAELVAPADDVRAADADRLPTISVEQFDEWRSTFVAEHGSAGLSPSACEALQRWQADRRSDQALPRFVRRRWNAKLKQLVLNRLADWFEARSEAVPDDLIIDAPQEQRSSTSRHRDETQRLRDVIVALVRVMTQQELEELRLPAAAYMRLGE